MLSESLLVPIPLKLLVYKAARTAGNAIFAGSMHANGTWKDGGE
jgi:hypothetical protein